MKKFGIILAIIGFFVLIGGMSMDTTKTMTTCYETDFSWDAADSSGCIETTVPNYGPKIATTMLGLFLILGSGGLVLYGNRLSSPATTQNQNDNHVSEVTEENPSNSFAEKLKDREN